MTLYPCFEENCLVTFLYLEMAEKNDYKNFSKDRDLTIGRVKRTEKLTKGERPKSCK